MGLLAKRNIAQKHTYFLTSIFFLFFLIALTLIFVYSFPLRETFYGVVGALADVVSEHYMFGITLFVVLSALSVVVSPFSSIPLVPVAVLSFGELQTTLFLLTGWIIGALITYTIGFFAVYPVLMHFVHQETIEYYKKPLSRKSSFWIVLLFRLAMPVEIPGYVLGALKYDVVKYALASFISLFPFAVLVVYASDVFLSQRFSFFIFYLILLFLLFAIFYSMFHKQLKSYS